MKSKNIFDYATKELSQDAFLRWLFDNYAEADLSSTCCNVLSVFLSIGKQLNVEDIRSLNTKAQVSVNNVSKIECFSDVSNSTPGNRNGRIDVLVEIELINGAKHLIVIEDKVYSETHDNQLKRYKDWADKEYFDFDARHFIFYKTDLIDKEEKDDVEKAGWRSYFLNDIIDIFSRVESDNIILRQYVDHLKKMEHDLSKTSDSPMKEWENINFVPFLKEYILDVFEEEKKERCIDAKASLYNYQGRYYSVWMEHNYANTVDNSGHDIRFTMGINARKYDNDKSGLTITVQLHYVAEKDERIIDNTIRKAFQSYLKENDDLFKMSNRSLCIATENNENQDIFHYLNDTSDWRNKIKIIFRNYITCFLEIASKSISEILQNYDDNEKEINVYDEPHFNYIIIKVRQEYINQRIKNGESESEARLNTTKEAWIIGKEKQDIKYFPYVFSVSGGIIKAVYSINYWYSVNGTSCGEKQRYGFKGIVNKELEAIFCGKRIPQKYRKKGLQSPLLYHIADSSKRVFEEQQEDNI